MVMFESVKVPSPAVVAVLEAGTVEIVTPPMPPPLASLTDPAMEPTITASLPLVPSLPAVPLQPRKASQQRLLVIKTALPLSARIQPPFGVFTRGRAKTTPGRRG